MNITNKKLLGNIGGSLKTLATKAMELDNVKSYAQTKLPKVDLENFYELSTKLVDTVKDFSTISEHIFSHLKTISANDTLSEQTLTKAAQLSMYQSYFKGTNILVDESFYRHLQGKQLTPPIEPQQLLIQFLSAQIERDELLLGEGLSDEEVQVFTDSLQFMLKQRNWIGAAMALHTYIDLLSQQLFRDFTQKDKARLEGFSHVKPKAKYAKKDRLTLTSNLQGVEAYQESMSSEEAEKMIPLVFVQLACATYDSFPANVSRNALVHFNSNVAFSKIDELYVYQHLQIAKVLEQQLPLNKALIFEVLDEIHS